jgi:hypothetical protein
MKSWHTFAVLIITAILIYLKAHYLILIMVAFIILIRCWLWFAYRFPLTAWFIFGFIRGLLGRRR